MSETKFTPGPWEVHHAKHADGEYWASIGTNGFGPITAIVGAEGNHSKYFVPVAGMKYLITPVEEQKANAHLISAAPDLYEACKAALGAFVNNDCIDWGELEAALAKAEGRKTT